MAAIVEGGAVIVNTDSWLKLAAKFGGYAVISGYLIYQLTGDIKTNTAVAMANTAAAVALIQQHVTDTSAIRNLLTVISNLELQNCLNDAGDRRQARDACFAAVFTAPVSR